MGESCVDRGVHEVLSLELSPSRCRASCFDVTNLLESRGYRKELLWVKCGVMALRLVRPRSARPAPIANTAPYTVAKTHAVW